MLLLLLLLCAYGCSRRLWGTSLGVPSQNQLTRLGARREESKSQEERSGVSAALLLSLLACGVKGAIVSMVNPKMGKSPFSTSLTIFLTF